MILKFVVSKFALLNVISPTSLEAAPKKVTANLQISFSSETKEATRDPSRCQKSLKIALQNFEVQI